MYGKMQSLGSLKSFLRYSPQLSGASILCFLILSLLRVHHWGMGGCSSWLLDCGHSWFPSWVPSGLTVWACGLDGCNILCLPIWQAAFLVHVSNFLILWSSLYIYLLNIMELFIYLCIYLFLFLAALGLRCCVRVFSSCGEWGLLFTAVRGLLIAVTSLAAGHGL